MSDHDQHDEQDDGEVILVGSVVRLLGRMADPAKFRMSPAAAKKNKGVETLLELDLVMLAPNGRPVLTEAGKVAAADAAKWPAGTKNAEALHAISPEDRDTLIEAAWDAIEALEDGSPHFEDRNVTFAIGAEGDVPAASYTLPNTVEALLGFCVRLGQRPFVVVDAPAADPHTPNTSEGSYSDGSPGALGNQVAVPCVSPAEVEASVLVGANGDERQEVSEATGAEPDTSPAGEAPVAPDLALFKQTLRDYQLDVVEDALAFHAECEQLPDYADASKRRILYSAPTGSGKGSNELGLLIALRTRGINAWILTPSLEVIRGFLERCGVGPEELEASGAEKLAALGERIYVTTPVRYRNRVLSGERQPPKVVLYDEVHHATEGNDVSGTLFALAPWATWVGFTATPYRGDAKSTRELERAWPQQVEVLSIPEAVEIGAWSLPTFEVVGLVDDDKVKVTGGDFQAKAAGKLLTSRVEDLARLVRDRVLPPCSRCAAGACDWQGQHEHDMSTAVTVPSREAGGLVVEALDRLGVDAVLVSCDTKPRDRAAAYAACQGRRAVLVSVRVLAEGVDMPWLRRLVDARPTMSPVSWIQQLGRITRPGDVRPQYICVCRNLERHAYLLGGLIPRRVVAEAQAEFEKPSKRAGGRSIGLEQLTRFKPIPLHLAGGVKGTMFALHSFDADTGRADEWVALLDPTSDRVVSATRTNTVETAEGDETAKERTYGKWVAAPLPEGLEGFATSKFRGKATKKQAEWWTRSARRHGLDPEAAESLSSREFSALPVLSDLRTNLHAQAV